MDDFTDFTYLQNVVLSEGGRGSGYPWTVVPGRDILFHYYRQVVATKTHIR